MDAWLQWQVMWVGAQGRAWQQVRTMLRHEHGGGQGTVKGNRVLGSHSAHMTVLCPAYVCCHMVSTGK